MHFGVAPATACCTLSALAPKWAVIKKLKMLRLVKQCLGDRVHVKVPSQRLTGQRWEPNSPHCSDLWQANSTVYALYSKDERMMTYVLSAVRN